MSMVPGEPLFIGIDIGTSATKCAAYSASGVLVAEASRPLQLYGRGAGWVEQQPDEYLATAMATLREVVLACGDASNRVAAIGVCGQMGGLIALDREAEPLFPADTTLDTRCDPFREQAMARYGTLILRQNAALPYTAPKLQWWQQHAPALYHRIRTVAMPHSFVAMRLAGSSAAEAWMDRTCIGLTGMADVRQACWSHELCALWGIDPAILPRVAEPAEVVGYLRAAVARDCGLPEGIPIVAGCGDAVAGWLGVGAVEPGVAVDTVGTSNHFSVVTADLRPDLEEQMMAYFPAAVPDRWHVMGYCADAGVVHRWFARQFASSALEAAPEDLQPLFAALEEGARGVPPGSERLFFVPHLSGRICPRQPELRGAWVGFGWQHRREHFYRALLESIAYEYALYLRAVRRLQPSLAPQAVRLIGGGARSDVWNQIKADVLGLEYLAAPAGTYSCFGAALLGGQGVGFYHDLAAFARTVFRPARHIAAHDAHHRQYLPCIEYYLELLRDLQPAYARLQALPV